MFIFYTIRCSTSIHATALLDTENDKNGTSGYIYASDSSLSSDSDTFILLFVSKKKKLHVQVYVIFL